MNGYKMFGPESSAWRDGFESGKRFSEANNKTLTSDRAILHIKNIIEDFDKRYEEMDTVQKMRCEDEYLWPYIDDIRFFVIEATKPRQTQNGSDAKQH